MRKALLDTNFLIHFVDEKAAHHNSALSHYEYFLNHDIKPYLSTIVIGEFCVRATFDELPSRTSRLIAYNLVHSLQAGKFAKILFDNNLIREIQNHRLIIANDVKLLAQASTDSFDFFVSGDQPCKRLFNTLANAGLVKFEYLDFEKPIAANFPSRSDKSVTPQSQTSLFS